MIKKKVMGKKKKTNHSQSESMIEEERQDKLTLHGVVEEALPGTWFRVKVSEGGQLVLCTLSGKLRQNHIMILPGDQVTIEVSPYDTSRGRVCWRR